MKEVKGAALEVLAGDVFQSLPAGPEVDAVAHLGVAGDGADAGIFKVGNELGDGVGSDDGIGIDADVDLLGDALEGVVEGCGLAFIGFSEHLEPAGGDLLRVGAGGHFSGAILRAIVDHDDAEILVVGVENRADRSDDDRFFVVSRNENSHARVEAGRGIATPPGEAVNDGEQAHDNESRAH